MTDPGLDYWCLHGELVAAAGLDEDQLRTVSQATLARQSVSWLFDRKLLAGDAWCVRYDRWRPPEGAKRRELETPVRTGVRDDQVVPDAGVDACDAGGDGDARDVDLEEARAAYADWRATWFEAPDAWLRRHTLRMAVVGYVLKREWRLVPPGPAAAEGEVEVVKRTRSRTKKNSVDLDPETMARVEQLCEILGPRTPPYIVLRLLVQAATRSSLIAAWQADCERLHAEDARGAAPESASRRDDALANADGGDA